MCRGQETCAELADPASWSRVAPLPPSVWIRDTVPILAKAISTAAAGDLGESKIILRQVAGDRIRTWCVEHGQMAGIFRHRALGAPVAARRTAGSGPRTVSPTLARRVHLRDGFTCRYCDLPVIHREVLKAFSRLVGPDVFEFGSSNDSRHGAAIPVIAQVDHVDPYNNGGLTDESNLVTSCWACNYGKDRFTVAQLGIDDPRARDPMPSGWDGLTSLLPGLSRPRSRQS